MTKTLVNGHMDIIECPECKKVQKAFVEHTPIWNVYLHECVNCGLIIMESEWSVIK